MEQETEGKGGGELGGAENKQPQPQPPPPQQQPQQHHQCPRCDSLNTKFCYYNNYSLSQPRYFCKACKRYWTKGGTLRNIPIGGGNRSKTFSSSTMNSSPSQPQLQPQPQSATQEVVQNQPNLTNLMRHTAPTVVQSTSPYYQGGGVGGGGYLSFLAAVHSLNPSSQPFKQSLNVGVGDVLASSNSGFLSAGFNIVASLGSQHHHRSQIRPSRFNQIGNRDREVESLLRAEQGYSIPSSMTNSSAASHSDHWSQSFTDNANHRASDASLWSTISTTSISGNNQNNIRGGSSSFIQNHWPNLPGYGFPQ